VLIAGGAALGAVTGDRLADAWNQLEKLVSRVVETGPMGEQYALRAQREGLFPTVRGDVVWLKADEVYKYGVTTVNNRYPESALQTLGLYKDPQVIGTLSAILVAEKIQLINYYMSNGQLPPGNKIFK
jgi:hypothetical protein